MSPLEQEITELWGHITAATHRFLELVGELDAKGGWTGVGIASCAHWLNLYCGIGIVAAREKVRVANAIRELPAINAAFREGRVSYSKVRAMTRVATADNEDILLNIALHGTAAHVERTASYYRRVEQIEAAQQAAKAERDRYLQFRFDHDEEHMILQGRLPTEVAELLRTALERAMEITDRDDSAESPSDVAQAAPEDRNPYGARLVDALRHVAAQYLAGEAERKGSLSDRFQVVVHIDEQILSGSALQPHNGRKAPDDGRKPHRCEFEHGTALAAETARRLACDGALVGIVEDDLGEPLSVGRRTRAISPALKRALAARDKGCRFPGCTHTRFTEGHHVEHWARGGETKLSNLVTLCRFHHHLVHEGGFSVSCTDDGLFRFAAPGGDRLPEYIPVERRFRGSVLPDLNRKRGVDIAPDTIITRWQGERMDYSLAIDALLHRQ